MAQLIVRNLEEDVKKRLQRQASRHGRSMEEEVRDILRNVLKTPGTPRRLSRYSIAGIATARRATLATRSTKHFRDLEIDVVDPWAAS